MISFYLHTIRYLKLKQIFARIWFFLIRPTINKNIKFKLRILKNDFYLPIQKQPSILNEDTFHYLNQTKSLSEISWNGHSNTISKLWRYNQHYFDDLNAIGSSKRQIWHVNLLKRWIKENAIGEGVGWEPYPVSLRIVNWIKWCLLNNILTDNFIKSLALQAKWLTKRIEWHILGNHLFTNGKALIFAGLFFSDKNSEIWLKKGLKIVGDELKEQILDDGGNFERSPMYHAIFLEDILDLVNISKTFPNIIPIKKVNEWIEVSKKMLLWLDIMSHPDGEISYFNDAAIGIAPNLKKLIDYAKRLGIIYKSQRFDKVNNLSNSGYIRLSNNDLAAFLDVAPIGPDYLPGHAHADTLSFEISLFGERLIVNSGTSEYGNSSIRQHERSTKAHNTTVINNQNSSEVWSGFRVARRAYPFDLKIKELESHISVSCAHDGYKRLYGKPVHKRNWKLFDSSLIIQDTVEGPYDNADAYFHFHPSITIIKNQNSILNLEMSNERQVKLEIKTGEPDIEESYYSNEFGKRQKTQCLKVSLDQNEGLCVKISWNN